MYIGYSESKSEALEFINSIITNARIKCEPLTETDVIDWNLTGNESFAALAEMTSDYLSELGTERAEYANRNAYYQD